MKTHMPLSTILTAICIFFSANLFGQGIMAKCHAPLSAGTNTVTGTALSPASSSQSVMAKNAMTATPLNYTSFTNPYKNTSAEAAAANAGYENHPEAGMLFPGTPCNNCYELIGKRTETTKTFQKEGISEDGGKDMMTQTSSMPMHYRDAAGNWRTITTTLQSDNAHKGVYAAMAQPAPVVIDAADKFTSLGKTGEYIRFNNNLELIYVKPDGSETSLGVANWANHTAGDQGAYIKNAWPGIDIEMRAFRGAIKTNFYVNHAMPAYADGKLLIRDHTQSDNSLSLVSTEGTKNTSGTLEFRDNNGMTKYTVSVAGVYEHNDPRNTVKLLEYHLGENNILDISLPGSYLNKPASAYPVVIDPLVSLATTTSPVNGATYNALWTAGIGCLYPNAAMTPPNCTVTDIQFAFEYTSSCAMEYVGFSFYKGTCRNPGTAAGGLSWSCPPPAGFSAGVCTSTGGAAYSIFSDMSPCLPPPSCPSIALNIDMRFYQNWLTTPACSTTWCFGSQPLVITVIGHTVELTAAGVTGTPATVCAGGTATLDATGVYGVPPYTYSWTPGPVTGSPATVNPTVTTTYVLTVTDACGITTGGNTTITVNPTTPITGTLSMCIGNTTTLADATAAGTWSSSNLAVATVGLGSGVVSGASTGTSTITYTTPAGCRAYAVVTVTPLPVAITGVDSMCQGATTALVDATPAGAWSSSNTAIATVTATGVVTGVAVGTATITYGTPGCDATVTVAVAGAPPLPVVSNSSPVCEGSTVTFTATDGFPGVTYSWTGPGGFTSALQNPVINPAGLAANGTYTVRVTTPLGCTSSASTTVVVNPNPVISILSFTNPTTCGGTDGTITLGTNLPGTLYNVTYVDNSVSFGTSITSDGTGKVVITFLDSGTYSGIYVTSPAFCVSNIVGPVTLIDPPTPPAPILANNEPICVGQTLYLTAVDSTTGGLYTWTFPNGATSTDQNQTIGVTNFADSGVYTVSYNIANCISQSTEDIPIYPTVVFTNITPNTAIAYGSSIQLNVDGALYYWWSPDDGSLNNPNINNPVATPKDSTVYTVIGTNLAGCKDTTEITITVINPNPIIIPTGFTPNGDGLNDVFKLGNLTYQKLVDFSVFNRWGQLVYHNSYDPKAGWDGTFNGVPQDMGVYNYSIILSNADGTNKVYKGDVTLIR